MTFEEAREIAEQSECVEEGIVSEDRVREEMRQNHVRHDAFEVLAGTPPLAA